MADPQQQINQFNAELDKVQDRLNDLGGLLDTALINKFSRSIVEVRKLTSSLKIGRAHV